MPQARSGAAAAIAATRSGWPSTAGEGGGKVSVDDGARARRDRAGGDAPGEAGEDGGGAGMVEPRQVGFGGGDEAGDRVGRLADKCEQRGGVLGVDEGEDAVDLERLGRELAAIVEVHGRGVADAAGAGGAGRGRAGRRARGRPRGSRGGGHGALAAMAAWTSRSRRSLEAVEDDAGDGDADADDDDDQGGERVDVGGDAELDLAPDQDRQRGGAGAGGEAGDDDVVERDGEGEEPAGEDRRGDDRQGDGAEHLPRAGAEVGGGFLDGDVGGDEAGADDGGDVAHREGDVGERDRGEAALAGPADQLGHQDEEHQHRDAGDDLGHDERRGDEAGEGGAAGEAAEAGEREAGHGAEDGGEAWR